MDYPYIRAWGAMLGSFPNYIEGEVEDARRDHVPQSAIYRRQDGTWVTLEQIENGEVRESVQALVKQAQAVTE